MKERLNILLLEDSPVDAEMIQRQLRKENRDYEFQLACNKDEFLAAIDRFPPDIILSDNSLPQFEAADALRITREKLINVVFILVTGTVSDEYAANIMKEGADDYILKDRMVRLPAAIDAALNRRKTLKEISDYRYALDQSADITITDPKGIIIYANENFCRLSQFSTQELIGSDHRLINSGYHPQSFFSELWNTIKNGKIWQGEVRNRAKDGSFYWVDTTIVPFLDQKKEPYQFLAIRKNITSRKIAEEKLLQTQKRLNQAQEIARLGNWELNLKTNQSTWSDEAFRIFGLKPGDHPLSFEDWMSFVHPDDREEVARKIKESERSFEDFSFTHRIIRKDGVVRHIYSEGKYDFADGTPVVVYGIVHDITESRMAEEALRKSNERFQFASRAVSDIIWELNFENKEYRVYEGRDRFFGSNKKLDWELGVRGRYIIEEDRERVRQSFRDARNDPSRELWEDEYGVYSMDNSVLHIINHAVFIRDKTGKAVRAIGAMTDITERKKLESDLREQQRQEQLKITASALAAQEKERNAIGQDLHDNVNQILVGTKLLLSMVKNKPDNLQELVLSSLKNLQLAIDENRRIAHELATPNLKEEQLADQMSRLSLEMLRIAGISVRIKSDHYEEGRLNSDQKLAAYRIAQEQCSNIVKHAKASEVTITVATGGDCFELTIEDNGVGMDSDKKDMGIGLRNINARVSVLNGSAEIISSPGQGFTLRVQIPL